MPLTNEVRQIARNWNFDSYLAATLAPTNVQGDLIALAAFVGDLERIRATVSEPALAQIRVQWWRDELQRIARDAMSDHPIGKTVLAAITRHDLPEGLLIGIADAIADQLSEPRFSDDHLLGVWITKRHAAPFELAMRCLGLSLDSRIVHQAGRACGFAALVKQARAGVDLNDAFGIVLTEEELISRVMTASVDVGAELAKQPRRKRVAYLPVCLTRHDVRDGKAPPERFERVWRTALAYWLGRF